MHETIEKLYSIFFHTYTYQVLKTFIELGIKLGPYILVSVLLHVILIRYIPLDKLYFSSGKTFPSIIIAVLLGMVSPFPTYVAVPFALSFISTGVPLSAIVAFAIASPLINPSIFFLTFTQLGPTLAIARVIATFILAASAGFLSILFIKTVKPIHGVNEKNNRPFWFEFYRSVRFFGKYFLISIFISALVKALLPVDFMEKIFTANKSFGLLLAMAMGVPFYSCGGAAIPIIQVLQGMGMSDGAALAFFISGPATKLETMYIYKSLFGVRVLVFYLLLTLAGALFFGLFLSYFIN